MDALNFAFTVILLTASGALAPGPLFFATISHGARSGAKSGLMFSIAHTFVEFVLVILLALGLLTVASEVTVKITVGIAGGIALLAFGCMQILDSIKSKFNGINSRRGMTQNLLLMGMVFTGLNPFFIVWWLSVGANLILISLEFASLLGVIFMYICHVWVDYVWLIFIAHFAKRGIDVVGFKWYRAIVAVFGVVLIYFGINFLINSFSFFTNLNDLKLFRFG